MNATTAAVCAATAEGLNVWLIPLTDPSGGRLLRVVMARNLEARAFALELPADADDNAIATAVRQLRRRHAAAYGAPTPEAGP